MKTIIVFIIIFLIFYFIWQFIKRMFFVKFLKTMNTFSQNSPYQKEGHKNRKKNGEFKKDINWDAETIDFEEIPDSKNR